MSIELKLTSQKTITEQAIPIIDFACKSITLFITPSDSNLGNIFIGDSSVSPANGILAKKGQPLIIDAPSDELISLQTIFAFGTIPGDVFSVAYLQEEKV